MKMAIETDVKIEFFLELVTSEHLLKVKDGNTEIVNQYPIAVGRYNDESKLWAADYRTPKGAYLVTAVHEKGSDGLERANRKYYPWHLANKFRNRHEDAGLEVYGDGIITLSYPNLIDIQRFRSAEADSTFEKRWKEFCTMHWKPIFEYQASKDSKVLDEIALDVDFGRKTLVELYNSIPSEDDFNMPFSIHGTNDPDCIGHDISAGCIRMHNEHIRELINKYVKVSTPVIIRYNAQIL